MFVADSDVPDDAQPDDATEMSLVVCSADRPYPDAWEPLTNIPWFD